MHLWGKRKQERHTIKLPVSIDAGNCSALRGRILETKDIGPEGAFIYSDVSLEVGSKVNFRTILPSGMQTSIHGLVWRTAWNGMAVRFEQECNEILSELGMDRESVVGYLRVDAGKAV
jgi:hypothetical protein